MVHSHDKSQSSPELPYLKSAYGMWCQLVVNVTGHTELQLYECKSDAMNHTSLDTVKKNQDSTEQRAGD